MDILWLRTQKVRILGVEDTCVVRLLVPRVAARRVDINRRIESLFAGERWYKRGREEKAYKKGMKMVKKDSKRWNNLKCK